MQSLQHIHPRRLRARCPIFLLLLLPGLVNGGAQPLADIQVPVSPVSIIDIPVRLSLEPLITAAEKMLPHQAGNWRTWKDWHGIKSQYRAWRGPLNITVSGDVLTVQAHIRYWIRAHKKLLGAVNLKGSCGIDEPPRQALIGMQVRLGWGPDWTLRPRFRILPTRFLDRCEMTIADIDVTPLVEKEFRKQMQNSLRAALRKLAPGMNAIQHQAQRTWSILQEPLELADDNWLMLRPTGVALSSMTGRGKQIDTHLAVSLQPALLTGSRPADKPAPLPPLARYYPRSPGLHLHLGVDLDFARLNQHIADALDGRSFLVKGRKTGITKLDLGGSEQEIRARLELTGELAGTAELRARLAYSAKDRRLEMHDLTFDYAAEDFAMDFLAQAFQEPIRQSLEEAANEALAQHLEQLNERLAVVLRKIAPTGMELDMSNLQLSSVKIHIQQDSIRLNGTASGAARLLLR
jgi:hypothetical protein